MWGGPVFILQLSDILANGVFVRASERERNMVETSRFVKVKGLRRAGLAVALISGLCGAGLPSAAYAEDGMVEQGLIAEVSQDQSTEDQSVEDQAVPGVNELPVTAPAEQARETANPSSEVAETRTISGTILFPAGTSLETKQQVSVGATLVTSDADHGTPVDTAQISYDPATGSYSVVDLTPGRYKVGIRLDDSASSWWFSPGTRAAQSWNDFSTGDFTGAEIDVTTADAVDQTRYFDPAAGGLDILVTANQSGAPYGDVKVVITNVVNGEEDDLVSVGGGGDESGSMTSFSGTFMAGTKVTLRVETEGVTAYYDGSDSGTLDSLKASVLTVPTFSGLRLGNFDVRGYLTPETPTEEQLTEQNRGQVRAEGTPTAGAPLRVFVGKDYAGELVYGWMFSTPSYLGSATVDADGFISLMLPKNTSGSHRLVISHITGWPVGWTELEVKAASSENTGAAKTLAETGGGSPLMLGSIAGGLILAGAALTLARRKLFV